MTNYPEAEAEAEATKMRRLLLAPSRDVAKLVGLMPTGVRGGGGQVDDDLIAMIGYINPGDHYQEMVLHDLAVLDVRFSRDPMDLAYRIMGVARNYAGHHRVMAAARSAIWTCLDVAQANDEAGYYGDDVQPVDTWDEPVGQTLAEERAAEFDPDLAYLADLP